MNKLTSKTFLSLIFVLVLSVISSSNISAATVSPSSGSYAYGTQVTLTIAASSVVSGQTAVNLDLTFTNATVLSYTAPVGGTWSTFLAGTPQCNGVAFYSSSKVCVALAKNTGTIVAGESLGSVTIRFDKLTGAATAFKTGNNVYINGDTDASEVDDGDIASFTITGTIPDTSLKDPVGRLVAFGGVLLVLIGLVLYRVRVNNN